MPLRGKVAEANEELAWKLFSQHCSAAAIGSDYDKTLEFESILPTTWKRLMDDDYVRFTNLWHFQLTTAGWIKTLETNGTLCSDTMKEDLGKISKRLKDRLPGRTNGPASVGTHEIVNDAGLPEYFVVNVIHSHLISRCFNCVDADWPDGDDSESVIEIPIDFGTKRTSSD